MKTIPTNTCGTCYYFNPKPRVAGTLTMPVGCCNGGEWVTGLEPGTDRVLASRPVVADDPSCDDYYLTEQES